MHFKSLIIKRLFIMKILELACYILQNFSSASAGGISPMKLQKLLFYVKAWGLVAGKELVEGDFVHYTHGPLNWDIYTKFKDFKSGSIEPPCDDVTITDPGKKQLIDFIVENYVEFDALTLSAMTHSELPWMETPHSELIPENLIVDYYSQQLFANNFPLDFSKPFYPVMTDMEYSFIFDMTPEDAQQAMVFPSYHVYKKLKADAASNIDKWYKKLVKEQ